MNSFAIHCMLYQRMKDHLYIRLHFRGSIQHGKKPKKRHYILFLLFCDPGDYIQMEEIKWETSVNNTQLTIRVSTKSSSRQDQDVKLIYVYFDKAVYCFVGKIVNKELRLKKRSNFNSVVTSEQDSELSFLLKEINIRSQLNCNGLCKLMAVRDSDQFTFLFEELCDLGVAMIHTLMDVERPGATLPLQKYLQLPENPSLVYIETEACYIMRHVFHTIQELHSRQICHLDIRPDNIYLTSEGEVKLGGTCFLTDFTNDSFGGLRNNLPGKKEYLQPEYWQSGFVSCFSADIWAACVTLYVLIKGHFPFPLDNIEGHILNMSTYNAIPDLSGFSPELTDLLTRCFSPNINNRLTIKEILNHPWFGHNTVTVNDHISLYSTPLSSTIPSRWTCPDMMEFEQIIDSCFDRLMKFVYGGIDGIQEAEFIQTPTEDKRTQFQPVPSREAIRLLSRRNIGGKASGEKEVKCSLPKQGVVRFTSGEQCSLCWKKSELYVERGKLVIGGIRKPNAISISVYDIHELGLDKQQERVFRIVMRDLRIFRLKATTTEEAANWIEAIRLSIRLS